MTKPKAHAKKAATGAQVAPPPEAAESAPTEPIAAPGEQPAAAQPAGGEPAAGPGARGSGLESAAPGAALLEAPEQTIQRLTEELEALKDRHLRLAAEFDNFRKRSQKERVEAWARAQADVALRLLDALDDLGRVAHLDAAQTTARDVLAGVELVERKLLRELGALGLERVGAEGEAFDPNQHEAVSSLPAPEPAADHRVAAVLQPGYRFAGALLRPARVSVYLWQPPAAEGEPAFAQ